MLCRNRIRKSFWYVPDILAEEKDRIMAELDQDESGTVDFYEFLEYIAKIKESKVKQNSAAALVVKKGFVSKVCAVQW